MKFFPLLWAGLWRKKTRTILTLLSVVIACADAGDDTASAALAPRAVQMKSRRSKSFSGKRPFTS